MRGWRIVNQQDQQAIDELFRGLYQVAQQGGPRDPEAEAHIQRCVQQAPPGLLYHMAQTLVAQNRTLAQIRAQQASAPPSGAPAGFGPPPGQPGYQAYGPPAGYQQPGSYQPTGWRQGGNQGGFLAGAGKIALGVGGGILGAEVIGDLFRDVEGIFDGDRGGYDRDYDRGDYDRDGGGFFGGDDRDRGPYDGQYDNGPYQDGQYQDGQYDNGQYDNGPVDDGGQFDGGFDNGDGGW
jgi:hypothetical protein